MSKASTQSSVLTTANLPKQAIPLDAATVIEQLEELGIRAGDMAKSTSHRRSFCEAHRRLKSLLSGHTGLGLSKSLDTLLSSFLLATENQSVQA